MKPFAAGIASVVFAVCVGAAVISAAHARGPKITVVALIPAQASEAGRLREVAVLPFEGTGGKEMAGSVEAVLTGIRLDDTQYFKVGERARLDSLLDEIRRSQSRLNSQDQALQAGKLMGVKGLYGGTVAAPLWSQSNSQEQRQVCAKRENKNNLKGWLGLGKCESWQTVNASCVKKAVVFSFKPRLIEIETGLIVYSDELKGAAKMAHCSDSSAPAPSDEALIDEARGVALARFRNAVAPSYRNIDIELIDSGRVVQDKAARLRYDSAIEFAKAKRLDRACELWREVESLEPPTMPVLYSLGVCAEVAGNLTASEDLYRKADRLLQKPDSRVSAALERIAKAKRDSVLLGAQRGGE